MCGGGGIMYCLELSITRSPFPMPESTPSLHPNSSKIIDRFALQKPGVDETAPETCEDSPLKTAGQRSSLPAPEREHNMQIAIPISRSAVFTPDIIISITEKGMSWPNTNADAQADAAFFTHFPSPRPSNQLPTASRAFDWECSSVSSANSSGGYKASTCRTIEVSTFFQGMEFFSTRAKSSFSLCCSTFGAPPDENVALIDRIVDWIFTGSISNKLASLDAIVSRADATEL
mmetsp:Transcript_17595/g.36793  ORF Transcript_17595/g.36793 Transcript_17595/m.36793 type:complete len:232 (+) Transcript_17595:2714-3409(+)